MVSISLSFFMEKPCYDFELGLHWIYNHLKIINVTYFSTYLGIVEYLSIIS